MSRSTTLARLDCQVTESCTLTKGLPTFIEIETRFNDGSVDRARGGNATKRYELSAQLKSRDGTWVKSYGGMGVKMTVKEASRFNANTLAKLPVTPDMIQREVDHVCEMTGIPLSEKGQAQLKLLIDNMTAAA